MKILAVETATEACSAALYIDSEILEKFELAPREHTRLILPMVDALMKEADIKLKNLDAVAFGCGPGSFTGIRIATGVIHGIAFGVDLPVVPVSTLAAMAQQCFDQNNYNTVFSAIDARIGEIYWGVYDRDTRGIAERVGEESVGLAEAVEFLNRQGFGVGSGWKIYHQELTTRLQGHLLDYDAEYLPRASAIARLGADGFKKNKAVPVEQAMPVYLRDKVAKKKSEH